MRNEMYLGNMAENLGKNMEVSHLKRSWDAASEESASDSCPKDPKDDHIPYQANKRPKESGDFLHLRTDEVNSSTPSHSCQSQSAESESDSGVPRNEGEWKKYIMFEGFKINQLLYVWVNDMNILRLFHDIIVVSV